MPDKFDFAKVTLPEFELLVPEIIYNKAIISLGILEEGIPCGVICASLQDYHYTVSWLYVDKKKRHKGYATALLTELLSVIREAGETYPMQATFTSLDADILGFFESYEHFYITAAGKMYSVSPESRKTSDVYKMLAGIKGLNCGSYYRYSSELKTNFMKKIGKRYPQFALMVNQDIDQYEPELTLAYGKNEIKAATFCKLLADNTIDISFMYADDAISLSMVLIALIGIIEKNYADYKLRIICVNDKSNRLSKKLFADAKPEFLLQADWDLRLPGEYPAFNR